jgi:hypothetical protein
MQPSVVLGLVFGQPLPPAIVEDDDSDVTAGYLGAASPSGL